MINTISNYFAGELNPEEKKLFLSEVYKDAELKALFLKTQKLLMYVDLLSESNKEEQARQNLSRFLQNVK